MIKIDDLTLYYADCMDLMKDYKDNEFDLAIVDPPYGIGDFQQSDGNYKPVKWNNKIPDSMYFTELIRISKNQIIWGANYYNCFNKNGACIIWDKLNMHPSMSRYEIASKSFGKKIDYFQYEWHGFIVKRIDKKQYHPCQKPIKLYTWLLKNYAKEGDRIIDTHLGSGSSAIACYRLGFEFTGIEIDKEYFDGAVRRIEKAKESISLLTAIEQKEKDVQLQML